MSMSTDPDDWISGLSVLWDGSGTVVLVCDADQSEAGQYGPDRPELLAIFAVREGQGWDEGALLDIFRPDRDAGWKRPMAIQPGCDSLALVEVPAGLSARLSPGDAQEVARIRLAPAASAAAAADRLVKMVCVSFSADSPKGEQPEISALRVRKLPAGQMLENFRKNRAREPVWAVTVGLEIAAQGSPREVRVESANPVLTTDVLPVRAQALPLRLSARDLDVPLNQRSILRSLHPVDPSNDRISVTVSIPRDPKFGRQRGDGLVAAQLFFQRQVFPQQTSDIKRIVRAIALKPLSHQDLADWGLAPRFTPAGDKFVDRVNLRHQAGRGAPDDSIHVEALPLESDLGPELAGADVFRVAFRGAGRGDIVLILDTEGGEVQGDGTLPGQNYVAWRVDGDRLSPIGFDPESPDVADLWDIGSAGTSRGPRLSWIDGDTPLARWLRDRDLPPGAFNGIGDPMVRLTPLLVLAYEETLRARETASRTRRMASAGAVAPTFVAFMRDPAVHRFLSERPGLVSALRNPARRSIEGREGHLARRAALALGRPDVFAETMSGCRQIEVLQLLDEPNAALLDLAVKARIRFDGGWSSDQINASELRDLPDVAEKADEYCESLEDGGDLDGVELIRRYQQACQTGGFVDASVAVGVIAARGKARRLAEKALADAASDFPTDEPRETASPDEPNAGEMAAILRTMLDRAKSIPAPDVQRLVKRFQRFTSPNQVPPRAFSREAIKLLREAITAPGIIQAFEFAVDALEKCTGVGGLTSVTGLTGEAAFSERRRKIDQIIERSQLPKATPDERSELTRRHQVLVADIKTVFTDMPEADPALLAMLGDYARVLAYHEAFVRIRTRLQQALGSEADLNPGSQARRLYRRLSLWPAQAAITVDQFERWNRQQTAADAPDARVR
jgi:hypothetical protein